MKPKLLLAFIMIFVWSGLFAQNTPDFTVQKHHWADSVLQTLTLEEKIGQFFMVAAWSNRDTVHAHEIIAQIKQQHIGGLIFFQGDPVSQAKLTNLYQSKAKVPLLIAMDAEWGLGMRLDSVLKFPYQMGLGATRSHYLVRNVGEAIGRQCKLMGVHWNFAPVADVNNNPENPVINFRSFGENKELVARLSNAYAQGMQRENVMACAKHFPGHGDTDTDSHLDLPVINHEWTRLDTLELFPFKTLINSGVASVMVAHLNIPQIEKRKKLPSTLSKTIVTDILQDSLNFNGLVVTDALNMGAITKKYNPGEADVKAFMAGNDVLLFPEDVPNAIQSIKEAVEDEKISIEEIDRRCRKILIAKHWTGAYLKKK